MEDGVGDAGDLDHFSDVVHADDVRPTKDRGRDRCGGAPNAPARKDPTPGTPTHLTSPPRRATLFTARPPRPPKRSATTTKRRPSKDPRRTSPHNGQTQRCGRRHA